MSLLHSEVKELKETADIYQHFFVRIKEKTKLSLRRTHLEQNPLWKMNYEGLDEVIN